MGTRISATTAAGAIEPPASDSPPWWRKASAKLAVIPFLTILAAAYTYKTTGAEELRRDIYQPLYADVLDLQQSVQAISSEKPARMKALVEIKKSGAMQRVPTELRDRLVKAADEASNLHIAVSRLQEMAKSQKGIADSTGFTFSHEGRSRGFDMRQPGEERSLQDSG